MKRFLLFNIILTLAIFIAKAQETTHVQFNGMSISGSLDTFIDNLKAKGLIVDSICNNTGRAFLHGNLMYDKIKSQNLAIFFTETSKTVNTIVIATPVTPKKQLLKIWNKYLESIPKKSETCKFESQTDNSYEVSYYDNNKEYLGSLDAKLFQSKDSASFYMSYIDWNGVLKGRDEFAEKYLYPIEDSNDHLNFMGVNLNDSLYGVCSKLLEKGFAKNAMYGKLRGFTMESLIKRNWGLNHDDTLHIDVKRIEDSQTVYSVELFIPCHTSSKQNSQLKIYRTLFDKKYGEAKLSKGRYTYKVTNTLGKDVGIITLSQTEYKDLSIQYHDLINTQIQLARLQEKVKKSEEQLAEARQREIEKIANDGKFHFTVNSDGSFSTIDNRPYYVINLDKKSAHQIFTNLQSNVSRMYVNPSEVMSGVMDETLIVNGMASNIYKAEVSDEMALNYSMLYRIEIDVKDGRIRVNMPSITSFPIEWVDKYARTLDYDSKKPSECIALFSGDEYFRNKVNDIINNTIYDIVFGGTFSDDW